MHVETQWTVVWNIVIWHRVIYWRREHITPVLFALHWLHIRKRIQFKLLLLVYRCTHQLATVYPTDLVVSYVPARSLRSADQNLLTVKRYNFERYGRRSFSVVAGPSLWNALPSAIRNCIYRSASRSSLFTQRPIAADSQCTQYTWSI